MCKRTGKLLAIAAIGLQMASCTSIGPRTISRDQFNYKAAIAGSAKQQLLANMVGMRYGEAPVFLTVSSVINQYTLEGQVSAGAGVNTSVSGGDTLSLGGASRWSDRPTITYTPLSGQEFARDLMTPLTVEALFGLLRAGWPADLVFRTALLSINGLESEDARPFHRHAGDPDFWRLGEIWRRLRERRVLDVRVEGKKDSAETLLFFRPARITAEAQPDADRFRKILGLDSEASRFRITAGLTAEDPEEIAVLTTSIFDVMADLAWRFDVPPEHVEEGRTGSSFRSANPDLPPLIQVSFAREQPDAAYVAVRNRGYWFYIDDRDRASKTTFAFLQLLLSLAETGGGGRGPLVSISN